MEDFWLTNAEEWVVLRPSNRFNNNG